MSTLRATYIRKVNSSTEEINEFYTLCKLLTINVTDNNIFNMDETFWRVISGNIKVIGHTNSENRKLITNGSPKAGFTAIFLISKNGLFHKPIISGLRSL